MDSSTVEHATPVSLHASRSMDSLSQRVLHPGRPHASDELPSITPLNLQPLLRKERRARPHSQVASDMSSTSESSEPSTPHTPSEPPHTPPARAHFDVQVDKNNNEHRYHHSSSSSSNNNNNNKNSHSNTNGEGERDDEDEDEDLEDSGSACTPSVSVSDGPAALLRADCFEDAVSDDDVDALHVLQFLRTAPEPLSKAGDSRQQKRTAAGRPSAQPTTATSRHRHGSGADGLHARSAFTLQIASASPSDEHLRDDSVPLESPHRGTHLHISALPPGSVDTTRRKSSPRRERQQNVHASRSQTHTHSQSATHSQSPSSARTHNSQSSTQAHSSQSSWRGSQHTQFESEPSMGFLEFLRTTPLTSERRAGGGSADSVGGTATTANTTSTSTSTSNSSSSVGRSGARSRSGSLSADSADTPLRRQDSGGITSGAPLAAGASAGGKSSSRRARLRRTVSSLKSAPSSLIEHVDVVQNPLFGKRNPLRSRRRRRARKRVCSTASASSANGSSSHTSRGADDSELLEEPGHVVSAEVTGCSLESGGALGLLDFLREEPGPSISPVSVAQATGSPEESAAKKVINPLFGVKHPMPKTRKLVQVISSDGVPNSPVLRVRNPLFNRYIPAQAAQRAQEVMYDAVMSARENGTHLSLTDDSELTQEGSFAGGLSMSSSFDDLSEFSNTHSYTSEGGITPPMGRYTAKRSSQLSSGTSFSSGFSAGADLPKAASAENISGRIGGEHSSQTRESSSDETSMGTINKNFVLKDGRYRRRSGSRRTSLLRSVSVAQVSGREGEEEKEHTSPSTSKRGTLGRLRKNITRRSDGNSTSSGYGSISSKHGTSEHRDKKAFMFLGLEKLGSDHETPEDDMAAAALLAELADDSSTWKRLTQKHMSYIVYLLASEMVSVQRLAARAVSNLTLYAAFVLKFAKERGLRPLITLALSDSTEVEVHEDAVNAIANIVRNGEVKHVVSIIRDGGVKPLLLLACGGSQEDQQNNACEALSVVALLEEGKNILTQDRYILPLTTLIRLRKVDNIHHEVPADSLDPLPADKQRGTSSSASLYKGHVVLVRRPNVKARDFFIEEFVALVDFLSAIRHKNILQCLGASTDSKNPFYLMEALSRGSLSRVLRDSQQTYDWKGAFVMAMGISSSLEYLASLNYFPDSLSPSMVQVDDSWQVKLCACVDYMDEPARCYLAPEVMGGARVTERSVVYTFGIILWELITRATPYSDLNLFYFQTAICEEGRRPHLPPELPDSVSRLLHNTWQAERAARMCFEDITCTLETFLSRLSLIIDTAPPLPLALP